MTASHRARRQTPSRRPWAALLLAAGWLFAGTAGAGVAPAYRVTDLGGFFATGVNDDGWVSGYDGRALLWRPGHELLDLGSFGSCAGSCSNRANAINPLGQVAGFTWSAAQGAYRAFSWQIGTGLVDLGDLSGGANASRAEAINATGLAAGQATGQFNNHPTYGFLSFGHAAVFDLEVLPPFDLEAHPEGTLNSIARGINDLGETVGDRQTSSGWRAIFWNDSGLPFDLGDAWLASGGPAAVNTFARDINNVGQVALQVPLGSGGNGAALWHPGGGFTLIGQVGSFDTGAQAVNDAGTVVGTAAAAGAAGQQAFVWSFSDGLHTLSSRLDAGSASWQIVSASGISEDGLIVGRGRHPVFGDRAVLLSPVPELPSPWLAMIGLAFGIGWRRLRAGG